MNMMMDHSTQSNKDDDYGKQGKQCDTDNHHNFSSDKFDINKESEINDNLKNVHGQLPAFSPQSAPNFCRGNMDGGEVLNEMNKIYDEVVFWKKNIFLLPSGKVGKDFVAEMTRLVQSFANATSMEGIALKALVILQVLILQKPHARSKSRDHVQCVQRRLELWKMAIFEELLREGRTLQHRLETNLRNVSEDQLSKVFSHLVIQGKINAALRYLSDNTKGGVLSLNAVIDDQGATVRELLHMKHPQQQPLNEEVLLQGPVYDISPVIFEKINGSAIRSAALRTQGAGGPSGVDSTA